MATDPGLRRLALRTLLASFPGPTAPGWALELLADGLAGYTLFGSNIAGPAQVAALTAELRATRPEVLIAIDEEGGDVTRLAHAVGSPYPGNAALGAVDDTSLTRRVYRAIGDELVALGVNLDLAPTVDVNSADDNPVIGTRAFGADPVRVAAHAAAAVAGLQQTGVAACAKHFPGHGATLVDSHHALPTVDVPLHVLRARDLPPFAAVVAADVKAIMTGHVRVPRLTGEDPATFSRAALVDLLRGEYGFTGAVLTDALEMTGAAHSAGGVGPAAVRALAAGADVLCIGSKADRSLVERVAGDIAEAIDAGQLPAERVEAAAGRTRGLVGWALGAAGAGDDEPDLGYAAARRAVRVEGSVGGFGSALVVQLDSTSTIAQGRVPWGLGPHIDGTGQVRVVASEVSADAILDTAGTRPIVLVSRNAHRYPATRALVESLAARHQVAVVEMGWPSAWRPAGARAFVVTYGASHANGRAAAEALGLRR